MRHGLLELEEDARYSKEMDLPDYPRKQDGKMDREAMIQLLLEEEYGVVDTEGLKTKYQLEKEEENLFAGKCQKRSIRVQCQKDGKEASFPFWLFIPYKAPFERTVIHLNFDPEVPCRYSPIEELMDMGLTIAYVNYEDVATDDGDFTKGLALLLSNRKKENAAGKIAIWAYSATLVADYLFSSGLVKEGHLAVAGHSRLGKTALLAGALDTRFSFVHSNCSGCSGAAISREKHGESIEAITRVFPFWFCPNYVKYANHENEAPFDQHFLLAAIAPRKCSIVAAEMDTWADTDAQILCAEAAGKAYEEMGQKGFVENGILKVNKKSMSGNLVFSRRSGTHFFSRDDWAFIHDTFLV